MPKKDPRKMSPTELSDWRKEMVYQSRMGIKDIARELGVSNYQTLQKIIHRGSKRSRYGPLLDDWLIRNVERRRDSQNTSDLCQNAGGMLREMADLMVNEALAAEDRLDLFLSHLQLLDRLGTRVRSILQK